MSKFFHSVGLNIIYLVLLLCGLRSVTAVPTGQSALTAEADDLETGATAELEKDEDLESSSSFGYGYYSYPYYRSYGYPYSPSYYGGYYGLGK